jgi:hypothetical protein
MTEILLGLSIDLFCGECDKFMGTLFKEMPTSEYKKSAREIMTYLNNVSLIPLCDICNTIKGYTIEGSQKL